MTPTMKQVTMKREAAGMMPETLAQKAGIHLRTLREIEGDAGRRVQARIRRGIAKALGCKPTELFSADGVAL